MDSDDDIAINPGRRRKARKNRVVSSKFVGLPNRFCQDFVECCLVVAGEDEVEFVSEKKSPKCHMSEQPSKPRKKRVEIAYRDSEAVSLQSFEASTAFVDGLEDQIGVNMIKAGPSFIAQGKF